MVITLFTFFGSVAAVLGICFFRWHPDAGRFYPNNKMVVLGHRGYLKTANENTVGAIKDALIYGADGAEVDIRQTKDGQLVLHHDADVQNEKGNSINIHTSNYSDIIKLQKKISGNNKKPEDFNIPLLEYIWTKLPSIKLMNLEIKAEPLGSTGFEKKVINLIHHYHAADTTLISSFNLSVIRKVKKIDKTIQTGLLWQKNKTSFFWFLPILLTCISKADALHLHLDLANEKIVKTCRRFGLKVNIWTINTLKTLETARLLNVDGIITDKTELIRKIK